MLTPQFLTLTLPTLTLLPHAGSEGSESFYRLNCGWNRDMFAAPIEDDDDLEEDEDDLDEEEDDEDEYEEDEDEDEEEEDDGVIIEDDDEEEEDEDDEVEEEDEEDEDAEDDGPDTLQMI